MFSIRTTPRLATLGAIVALATIGIVAGPAQASTAPPASTPASSPDGPGVTTIAVQLTAEGCPAPEAEYPAGALTFDVENVDATAVTEFEVLSGDRILGEKENLPPGFSGSFSLDLGPGTYELYCPGAGTERSEITLVGDLDESAPTDVAGILGEGAAGYLGYVQNQVVEMVTAVDALDEAIQSGDVEASSSPTSRPARSTSGSSPSPSRSCSATATSTRPSTLRADDVEPTEPGGLPPHRVRAVGRRFHRRVGRHLDPARGRRRAACRSW